jgi:type II secretory pathway pseudopilin PulG
MKLQGKPSSFPFRKLNNSGRVRGGRTANQNGYALLIVMMMATILMVSLTAALPNIYVEGQRERETELIFRGRQYARAIALFHQQFNRYPSSVKELLHTNDLSFLRRAYRDPVSKSGKWRFIHATATGVILDSKILGSPGQQNNKNGSGSQLNPPKTGENTPGTTSGQNTPGGEGFSLFGGQGAGTPSGPGEQGKQSKSIFGEQNQLIGAYIVGVASTSKKTAIRVFEGRTHYDEWEFLGVPGAPGGPSVGGAGGGVPSVQGEQAPMSNQGPQSNPNQNSQPKSIFGSDSNPP